MDYNEPLCIIDNWWNRTTRSHITCFCCSPDTMERVEKRSERNYEKEKKMVEVGLIKTDGEIRACSLEDFVTIQIYGEELFRKYFQLTSLGGTVKLKDCKVIGILDMRKGKFQYEN